MNGRVMNGRVMNGRVMNGRVMNGRVINGRVINGRINSVNACHLPCNVFFTSKDHHKNLHNFWREHGADKGNKSKFLINKEEYNRLIIIL
jgi:hypothetical protein